MPFGLIFGALFFGGCAWLGLRWLGAPGLTPKLAGLLMLLLGVSLTVGLLSRRNWARWIGSLAALGMTLFGLWLANLAGGPLDLIVLLVSLTATVLLVVPATSDVRRGLPENRQVQPGSRSPLAAAAVVSLAGLAVLALWTHRSREPAFATPARPAMLSERMSWTDFGAGLQQARNSGKPLLVSFITTWCGYCKKMDRTTWKHPSVIERMQELVTVEVDAEETRGLNGFTGLELANRYQVAGTPTILLLDSGGEVLARTSGYRTARQLLSWVEDSLNQGRRTQQAGSLRVKAP